MKTALHCIVQHSTVLKCTVLCSTVLCSAVVYCVKCCAVMYTAVLCCTASLLYFFFLSYFFFLNVLYKLFINTDFFFSNNPKTSLPSLLFSFAQLNSVFSFLFFLLGPNELYNMVSKEAFKKLLLIVSTVDRAIVRDRISKKEKEKELEKVREIEKEKVRERDRGRERGREWHEGSDSLHRPSGLSKKILSSLSPAEDLWLEKRKQSQITDITRNPSKSPTSTLPVGIIVSGHQSSPIIIDDSFDCDGCEYEIGGRGGGREDETFNLLESPEMIGLLTERNSDGSSLLLWAAEEGLDELAGVCVCVCVCVCCSLHYSIVQHDTVQYCIVLYTVA